MKLAAIFIVWDDWDILHHAVKAIDKSADEIIIVYSLMSNNGELSESHMHVITENDLHFVYLEPHLTESARWNEARKRNAGLDKARELECTNFLMLDADEFYEPFDKTQFDGNFVCSTRLYFTPTLYVEDGTRVPFIHKLTPDLKFVKNYEYPYSATENGPAIDPTRTLNITEGVQWTDITMHHMSLVRMDITKKIRNSAGEKMKQFSHLLLEDITNAKPGYRSKFYRQEIKQSENIFSIPNALHP